MKNKNFHNAGVAAYLSCVYPDQSLLDEALGGRCHLPPGPTTGSWCPRRASGCVVDVTHLDLTTQGVELICLCYLEAVTPAQIRYAISQPHICRRISLKVLDYGRFLGRPMSVPDDEASTAGAEFVQGLPARDCRKDPSIRFDAKRSENLSLGTPVALMPSSVSRTSSER